MEIDTRWPWLNAQANLPIISIDPFPRLWIFGFDGLQVQGVHENIDQIQDHMTTDGFGPVGVIPVGRPTSITETHFA